MAGRGSSWSSGLTDRWSNVRIAALPWESAVGDVTGQESCTEWWAGGEM